MLCGSMLPTGSLLTGDSMERTHNTAKPCSRDEARSAESREARLISRRDTWYRRSRAHEMKRSAESREARLISSGYITCSAESREAEFI